MAELTLILGAENNIVATLTPAIGIHPGSPRCVGVLSNSGVISRIGPHRMNVRLARRFAQMGIPSIRFDMSGLGDSLRSGSSRPIREQWVADTRAVMDAAQLHFGCDRFFMIGFCSGASVAHRVALEDRRLRAAVLWDSHEYPTLRSRYRTALYRLQRAGLLTALRRGFGQLLPWMRGFGKTSDEAKNHALADFQAPSRDEFATSIQSLVDDGVELLFAYSGGASSVFNYRGQFRRMFGGYPFVEKVAFNFLETSDHLLTRREAQQAFLDMAVDWLGRRVLEAAQPLAPPR